MRYNQQDTFPLKSVSIIVTISIMNIREPHPEEVGSFIRRERERRGLSLEDVAAELGKGKNWLSRLERGLSRMPVDAFVNICRVLGINAHDYVAFYDKNDGSRFISENIETIQRDENSVSATNDSGLEIISYCGVEYTRVPEYRLDDFDGAEFYRPPRAWHMWQMDSLKEIVADNRNVVSIYIDGDDMSPTLRRGDCALIDRGVQAIGRESIYAISPTHGQELLIKRCRRDLKTGSLSVSSDNPTYPAQDGLTDENIRVIGRVAWIGKRM